MIRRIIRWVRRLYRWTEQAWLRFAFAPWWQHPGWVLLGIGLGVMLGVGLVYWSGARWGPGATTDGLTYLILARNLQRFKAVGFLTPSGGWEPVTLWPPGYPLAIRALMPFTHGDAVQAVRWLSLAFLALLVALVAREVYEATHHAFPTVAVTLWAATAFPILRMYAWIHSEEIFLVQILLASWAVTAWLRRPSYRRAVLAGLLAAWATSTRWIGVVFVPWMLTAFYLGGGREAIRSKMRQVLAFLLAAGVPIGALFWATKVASGNVASRKIGWHPPSAAKWRVAAQTVVGWVTPPFREYTDAQLALRAAIILGAAALLVAVALYRLRHASPGEPGHAQKFFLQRWAAWVLWYIPTLIVAITLVAPQVWMHLRILSPAFLGLLLLVGVAAWGLLARRWWGALLLLVLFVQVMRVNKAYDSFFLVYKWHRQGALLRSATYQKAEIWSLLRALPPEVTFYSSKWRETYYYTDRPAYALDANIPRTPEDFRQLAHQLQGTCTALVVVTIYNSPEQDPNTRALIQGLTAYFPLWRQVEGGLVFTAPAPSCPQAFPSEAP